MTESDLGFFSSETLQFPQLMLIPRLDNPTDERLDRLGVGLGLGLGYGLLLALELWL